MTGSAVPAALTALAAAWQAEVGSTYTVEVGTPVTLDPTHLYVAGQVTDWQQNWGVTPHVGVGLEGGRDEFFILTARMYRKKMGATLVDLLTELDPYRLGLEAALRADSTLGGALSTSGMAQIESMSSDESLADDRSREVGITVLVRCRAWIS